MIRDALLHGRPTPLPDGAAVSLDRAFQGLPDMAHGGTVLALFDAVAGGHGARRVRAHYMKRVPLATDLTLRRTEQDEGTRLRLVGAGGTTLVDGLAAASPAPLAGLAPVTGRDGHPLPVSRSCFVCGFENDLGLRATLGFDDDAVTGRWPPRALFRRADGTIAPIALTGLLDEAAFWLGALATGESGMTTELDVTLVRPVPFGTPITIVGERRRVTPRADDARYVDTEIVAYGDGQPAATARITFVAVRGAARRLASWLGQTNAADVIARVFDMGGSGRPPY